MPLDFGLCGRRRRRAGVWPRPGPRPGVPVRRGRVPSGAGPMCRDGRCRRDTTRHNHWRTSGIPSVTVRFGARTAPAGPRTAAGSPVGDCSRLRYNKAYNKTRARRSRIILPASHRLSVPAAAPARRGPGAPSRGGATSLTFIDGLWSVRDGMYGAMDGSQLTVGGYKRRTRRTDSARASLVGLCRKSQMPECRISLPKSRA
jgi:hypothetical protein